jgi:hypothetical protein
VQPIGVEGRKSSRHFGASFYTLQPSLQSLLHHSQISNDKHDDKNENDESQNAAAEDHLKSPNQRFVEIDIARK